MAVKERQLVVLGIKVSQEERAAFDAYAKSRGMYRAHVVRAILHDVTGIEFHVSPPRGHKLSPATVVERWLAKNQEPEIRALLLKALENGHA